LLDRSWLTRRLEHIASGHRSNHHLSEARFSQKPVPGHPREDAQRYPVVDHAQTAIGFA
jgi:hypothetical protein